MPLVYEEFQKALRTALDDIRESDLQNSPESMDGFWDAIAHCDAYGESQAICEELAKYIISLYVYYEFERLTQSPREHIRSQLEKSRHWLDHLVDSYLHNIQPQDCKYIKHGTKRI